MAKHHHSQVLRRIGKAIRSANISVVHVAARQSLWSPSTSRALAAALGPNFELIATEGTHCALELAKSVTKEKYGEKGDYTPRISFLHHDSFSLFNGSPTQKNRIHGKSGPHLRPLLITTPRAPEWTASPLIDQTSHTTVFSNQSATNITQEFAIRLQNNANYDRETLFKHRPENKPPPTSSLTATLQELFPAKDKQKQKKKKTKKQQAQTAAKKKKEKISKEQWKEITDANKKLLAEQKAWKKNQDFLKEHDSPDYHLQTAHARGTDAPLHCLPRNPDTRGPSLRRPDPPKD
jgi:hypothetical protein